MKHIPSALLLLAALPALAGTSDPVIPAPPVSDARKDSPPWEVRTALYGWAQSLEGDIAVRGLSAPVDIPFDDILGNLDLAAMGAIEVSRGRWSVLADLNYAEISEGILLPPGAPVPGVEFSQDQFLGNFLAIYEARHTETSLLDVYAGARVNAIDVELSTVGFSRAADESWVDPLVGARFQTELGESTFLRLVGDIGGFGVSSDLTWQTMAALGWRVMDQGSLLIGYRAIGTDYSDGGFTYDVVAHGPALGFEWHF